MTRNQVNLTQPGAYAELQRIAARLGFLQTHGPRAGEGSVAKMMEAIARGELEIVSRDGGDTTGDTMTHKQRAGAGEAPSAPHQEAK